MAAQPNSRSGRWSYQNTLYSHVVSQLVSLGKNLNSIAVVCPKEGCQVQLFLTKQLYRHIERCHPEDRRHQRDYTTYGLLFVYFSLNNVFITPGKILFHPQQPKHRVQSMTTKWKEKKAQVVLELILKIMPTLTLQVLLLINTLMTST